MKVFLVTGEVSGDKHAAHLAAALKRIDHGIGLYGMGGPMMKEAGVDLLSDISGLNAFQYRYLPRLLYRGRLDSTINDYCRFLRRENPDIVVVVGLADDTTYVAMRIAQCTRAMGIPVFYYFAPHVWMWSRRKTKKVAERFDCILTIFPQEEREYKKVGARTLYVGHPIVDEIEKGRRDGGDRSLLSDLGLREEKVMTFFPGSRTGELRYHLPIIGRIIEEMVRILEKEEVAGPERQPEYAYIISALNEEYKRRIERYFRHRTEIRVVTGRVYSLIECSDAVVTSSGTITLEIALHEKPHVIIYRVPWITYVIGRSLLGFRYIGMPNVIMDETVVPEFLQGKINPRRIAHIVLDLIKGGISAESMRKRLRDLGKLLGGGGAVDRAATAIVQEAQKG
jgi:lipid-A-disaccharide synthase